MEDIIKGILTAAVSLLLAVIQPTALVAILAFVFWLANFFVGMWKSSYEYHKNVPIFEQKPFGFFSGSKAFRAFELLFVVLGILLSIAFLGCIIQLPIAQIIYAQKAVGVAFVYYLVVNINKNLLVIYPEDEFFTLLSYWLSLQIVKRIFCINYGAKKRNNRRMRGDS